MYLLKFINVYTVQGCTSTQDKSNLLVSLRVTGNFSSDMFKKISSSCLHLSVSTHPSTYFFTIFNVCTIKEEK